jgi:GPH family glycoside/pentoside/hexuronide:cation symporter
MNAQTVSATTAPTASEKVPLLLQILYGLGEIPITATMGLFGIYVLFFYNSVMGLDAALAGIGSTAGLVVDAVLDPYIGFRSDVARFRFGRRQSFMLFGCVGMGPLFFLLLSPPQGLGQWPLFCWLLIASVGFRFCFAVYRIPYLSLGAELTRDYDERTRVIAIRSLLGLIGLASAATLPLVVFFHRVIGDADPKLQYSGYPKMGAAFGAVMTLAGLIAAFGTQSRRTWGDAGHAREEARHFFSGMWVFLKNPNFRAIWLAFTICSMAVVVNFSLNLQFLKWYVGIEDHRGLSLVQAAFYLGAVLGVLAWIWVVKRGEKRTFLVGSVSGLALILCLATLLMGRGHLFGVGNPAPLICGNFFAGLCASALWVLPFSMMADVVDEDTLQSGMRREGICFGIMNFGEKIASGGALGLSGLLLRGFVHIAPGSETQSASATSRLGIAYGIIPAALMVIAIFMTLQFRLRRRDVEAIQAKLNAGSYPSSVPQRAL